jgi:hypothetical protein
MDSKENIILPIRIGDIEIAHNDCLFNDNYGLRREVDLEVFYKHGLGWR